MMLLLSQFYFIKTDLSNIQVDGDCNTIYIITNGVGNTKSLQEKPNVIPTADKTYDQQL